MENFENNKMNKINEGITDQNERVKYITDKNIQVLEETKEILTLKNIDFITVDMCANFFNVPLDTMNSLIKNNRHELIENGLLTISSKEFKEKFVKSLDDITNYRGYFEYDGQRFANRSTTLISKRVMLNIAMLLRDSEVAKEVRKRILDIVYDAEEGNADIKIINNEITEEQKLKIEYVDAMMSGDLTTMNEINAKLFELKNKRITELENENQLLKPNAEKYEIFMDTDGLTTIDNFSKSLGIKGLGRNNMHKYLRELGYLQKDNTPYQRFINEGLFIKKYNGYHMEYGEVIYDYKTFITPKGVDKLIKVLTENNKL